MKTLTTLVVGAALGFGLAQFIGKAKKQFIRLDEVTLKRTELDHVIRAINLLKDRPAEPAYTRYVADSGEIEFECPTEDACNLTTPARGQVKPRKREAVLTGVTSILTAPVAEPISEVAPLDTTSQRPHTALGLRIGDTITAINGKPVDGVNVEGMKHLDQLLKQPVRLDVTFLRDGQEMKLSIQR